VHPSFARSGKLTENQQRTLATVKKIDNFPLYEMHYYADYEFGRYLQTGVPFYYRYRSQNIYTRQGLKDWACTCFAALNSDQMKVFGRNFDWYQHPALILFTDPPNAYASVSMVDISYLGFDRQEPSEDQKQRLLKAPYYPFDGMNEHGLAVGMMAISSADSGHDSQKMTLSSLEIIRLLLDYAKDVDEAIVLFGKYNIDFGGGPPVHYLIADRSGDSAVVEFIKGEMSVLQNDQLWQVSTNFVITGTTSESAKAKCWRYRKASETLEQVYGKRSQSEAMTLLKSVSQARTIWSTVYMLTTGNIQVVMGQNYDTVHSFSLKLMK